MKHAIIPALLLFMAIACPPLQAQPEPVVAPRLPANFVRQINPRATRFIASLDTGWWHSRTMGDLHDTTIIPWSMQLTDVIDAVRSTGDTSVSFGMRNHGEHVVTLVRSGWSYILEERYGGGGLAAVRMYKYVENQTLTVNASGQGTLRGDSTAWAQVMSSGILAANGPSTYSSTDSTEATMVSMSLHDVASRQRAQRLIVVSVDRHFRAPEPLRGTQWKIEAHLDDPRLVSSFAIGFHQTDRYVIAPCSDCHTTTWPYHMRSADSIQIWAQAAVCPTLCIGRTLPQYIMDVLGSTWGVIDDDTITFEGNGTEVILKRMDP
ncbi:MAG: hypothetical protein J0I17_03125 ['Candidatus Kapabacteria' thiocyanatum]|nr:hypothetical protein ['Candidatus Kapabacteria' thiocyanatum]